MYLHKVISPYLLFACEQTETLKIHWLPTLEPTPTMLYSFCVSWAPGSHQGPKIEKGSLSEDTESRCQAFDKLLYAQEYDGRIKAYTTKLKYQA